MFCFEGKKVKLDFNLHIQGPKLNPKPVGKKINQIHIYRVEEQKSNSVRLSNKESSHDIVSRFKD